MTSFTYTQFLNQIQSFPELENKGKAQVGFAPRLAFGFLWIAFQWSQLLGTWDKCLKGKKRSLVYSGLVLLLLLIVLLPRWKSSQSPGKAAASLVLSLPLVPIEPTFIPDTLLISSSLNQHYHEK
ncbi:hypothetical protein [Algoriphagus namhaensis]